MAKKLDFVDLPALDKALFIAMNRVYLDKLISLTPLMGENNLKQQWDFEKLEPFHYALNNPEGEFIKWFEEGKDPFVIVRKNKKFLRFKKPDGWDAKKGGKPNPKISAKLGEKNIVFSNDKYVWAKGVMHPGFEARHFIHTLFTDQSIYNEFQSTVMRLYKSYLK